MAKPESHQRKKTTEDQKKLKRGKESKISAKDGSL